MFCNPLSGRLVETNFYRFSLRAPCMRLRMYVSHFYEVSLFRCDMVPDRVLACTLRNAYTAAMLVEVRCWHSRAGRNSKPRNARDGAGAAVFFHGATNSALAASRMSLTTALAEPLGETDREYDPFFFPLTPGARRTNVSFCEPRSAPVSSRSILL